MNAILSRTEHEKTMISFLKQFNKHDEKSKKCVYIYGPPGCGKSTFAKTILTNLNYDVISYDAGDTRNKNIVDSINVSNMSDKNILSIFNKKKLNIAILMDEIDCMNNGDKGGINSLIKLIRPKKTKKQKTEDVTHVPIICIGSNSQDKKIKELMKCCVVIELKGPTPSQMKTLMTASIPAYAHLSSYVRDLKKMNQLIQLEKQNFKGNIQMMFYTSVHEDSKQITKRIMNSNMNFSDHVRINDTDRTIVSLMWHENIIDLLQKMPMNRAVGLYNTLLKEICFSDYIDRITFQKQLWVFNEMSFLIKTFYTNYLFQLENKQKHKLSDVRFTKVLTKYSTEYNNSGFIQKMCTELCMDKSDLFSYMNVLKEKNTEVQIAQLFENTEITLLDVQRMYRYMNKFL
jgi:ABC-type cobalamin/Fe3+-siderophores transport system ATPase subunit